MIRDIGAHLHITWLNFHAPGKAAPRNHRVRAGFILQAKLRGGIVALPRWGLGPLALSPPRIIRAQSGNNDPLDAPHSFDATSRKARSAQNVPEPLPRHQTGHPLRVVRRCGTHVVVLPDLRLEPAYRPPASRLAVFTDSSIEPFKATGIARHIRAVCP